MLCFFRIFSKNSNKMKLEKYKDFYRQSSYIILLSFIWWILFEKSQKYLLIMFKNSSL